MSRGALWATTPRRALTFLFCLSLLTLVCGVANAQEVIVAGEVTELLETPHPYPEGTPQGKVVWEKTIRWPDAAFIVVHFDRFELAPGDFIELRDPSGKYRHVYHGKGYKDRGGDFWGLSVYGDTMEIRLISRNTSHRAHGVTIDRWTHGFPFQESDGGEIDALCGPEDFRDIECYKDTYPTEYEMGRRAVRLIKNGSAHCTGWIASCENHIVTNEHCVGSQGELDQIEFQFEYKRSECGSGDVGTELQLHGGTLLEYDAPLDYALIMPQLDGHDPQATYGFMQWDIRLPNLEELMYIPGHPSGDPKRLSIDSTHPEDQSGRCEVYSTDQTPCSGGPGDIGYYCDTEGGSSGSAVLSSETHKVIALHHCANCPNRGVPINAVYNDIQASPNPLPACVTCQPAGQPQDLFAFSPADNSVQLDWQIVSDAVLYHVYRNEGSCDDPMTEIGTTTTNTFLDESVAGELTYNYRVTAESECGAESAFSECETVTPSGLCTEPPRFDGATRATSARQATCGITVSWDAATARCGSVRYNVYRGTTPDFVPTPAHVVGTCIDGLNWTDSDVLEGVDYYYVVRAEDATNNGTGACNGGNTESNVVVASSAASGPDDVFYTESFESVGSGWIIAGEFQIGVPRGKGGSAGGGTGPADPQGSIDGHNAIGLDFSGMGNYEGNYENNVGEPGSSGVSPVIDATGRTGVHLRFQRWLGVLAGDKASVDVYDGADWHEVWTNENATILDGAWVEHDVVLGDLLSGSNEARIRFGQQSDGSGVAGGWTIDKIELYSPTSCESTAVSIAAIADGNHVSGTPMMAEAAPSGEVRVTWDATRCPASSTHLFHGDAAGLAGLSYTAAVCDLVNGEALVTLPTPDGGGLVWWLLAGAEGAIEGVHGYDSRGIQRSATGAGHCGVTEQQAGYVCP